MTITIDMAGRAALVTGAGSGLGRATARKLAQAGADLCLVDVNAAALEETAGQLQGVSVLTHVADLADPAACRGAVAAVVERFGRLDALCNIAGVFGFTHAEEMSEAAYLRTIAINLNAPFFLTQAAIPYLLASDSEGGGAVVNCASCAALIGEAYAVAYCASKAGLVNMTKALAMEYVRKPIRFNAVAPGGMMTNIATGMAMPEGLERDLIGRYAGLRGMVEVDDVADMIVLLASPAGRSYHGACITIDAGITAG